MLYKKIAIDTDLAYTEELLLEKYGIRFLWTSAYKQPISNLF